MTVDERRLRHPDDASVCVLVVSGDPGVRADWANQLQDEGFRVLRCAGPLIDCAIVRHESCPLLSEVHFAVYDERSVTPEWLRAICGPAASTTLVVAGDHMRSDGRHEPMLLRPNGAYVPLRWALAKHHVALS